VEQFAGPTWSRRGSDSHDHEIRRWGRQRAGLVSSTQQQEARERPSWNSPPVLAVGMYVTRNDAGMPAYRLKFARVQMTRLSAFVHGARTITNHPGSLHCSRRRRDILRARPTNRLITRRASSSEHRLVMPRPLPSRRGRRTPSTISSVFLPEIFKASQLQPETSTRSRFSISPTHHEPAVGSLHFFSNLRRQPYQSFIHSLFLFTFSVLFFLGVCLCAYLNFLCWDRFEGFFLMGSIATSKVRVGLASWFEIMKGLREGNGALVFIGTGRSL
jgi:hypothetical protein